MDFYGGAENSFQFILLAFSSLVSAGIPEKNAWGYHRGVVDYFSHVGSLEGWEPWCQNQVENPRFICCSSGAKAA